MKQFRFRKSLSLRILLGLLALVGYAVPGSAVYGVRRRTAAVAYGTGAATTAAAASSTAASQQQQAAAANQAAAQSAAASQQAAAAASQAAAAAGKPAAPAPKTMQQKLEELQSLYKQGLITESEYSAQKAKVLAEGPQ